MDTLNIIILASAGFGIIALAWLGGYQLGEATGADNERAAANIRINGILRREKIADVVAYENNRRPKARKNRAKAARKAVRA
jgi:hypothetical protein